MVWQIVHNFDTEGGKENLNARSPFLEISMMFSMEDKVVPGMPKEAVELFANSLELVKKLPSPRTIKTHLPFTMLPPKLLDTCKVVFVARNPKVSLLATEKFLSNIEAIPSPRKIRTRLLPKMGNISTVAFVARNLNAL